MAGCRAHVVGDVPPVWQREGVGESIGKGVGVVESIGQGVRAGVRVVKEEDRERNDIVYYPYPYPHNWATTDKGHIQKKEKLTTPHINAHTGRLPLNHPIHISYYIHTTHNLYTLSIPFDNTNTHTIIDNTNTHTVVSPRKLLEGCSVTLMRIDRNGFSLPVSALMPVYAIICL